MKLGARLQPNWTSFIGAAEGVLRAAGMIDPTMDRHQLMGLSGRAFHFVLDDELWPGCPTAYDWLHEHTEGLERIGVHVESYFASHGAPAYDAACRRAATHISEALDRGVGVVLWGVDVPEFGVVYGYDDADGVFLVDGVARMNGGSSTPILYENVGRTSDVPELNYVVPVERIPWDAAASHRAALADYVAKMERRSPMGGKRSGGLAAYDTWLAALEHGKFIPFGLRYNTVLYGDAKISAGRYFQKVAVDGFGLTGIQDVASAAEENAGLFQQMLEALGMGGPSGSAHLGQPVTEAQAKGLMGLVREARSVERRQVEAAKRVLGSA